MEQYIAFRVLCVRSPSVMGWSSILHFVCCLFALLLTGIEYFVCCVFALPLSWDELECFKLEPLMGGRMGGQRL